MNTENLDAPSIEKTTEDAVAKNPTSRTFDPKLIDQFVGQAREQGLAIDGENGLLAALTKRVVESALEGEITDHLGYEKHERG
ncbi:hypothetical protein ACTXJC_19680, partial [Glutamicibacter ardleyensis]